MRMRTLGRSGLFVSELCFGTMTFGGSEGIWGLIGQLDQTQADELIKTALEGGINFFDTANAYGEGASEKILGQSLKNLAVKREELVIATKVLIPMGKGPNNCGASRGHILHQVKASLTRLQLDYIDLYQIHGFDPATPIEETLEALNTLVQQGYVRYIGLSNWAAWQVVKAIGITQARHLAPIISLQAYYTLVGRDLEREVLPMLESEQVGLMVWSPLAGGYLSGKYSGDGQTESGRRQKFDFPPVDLQRGAKALELIRELAKEKDCSVAQVALAWLLHQNGVSSVIIGAKNNQQLQENLGSVDVRLNEDELLGLKKATELAPEYPGWMLERQGAHRQ